MLLWKITTTDGQTVTAKSVEILGQDRDPGDLDVVATNLHGDRFYFPKDWISDVELVDLEVVRG